MYDKNKPFKIRRNPSLGAKYEHGPFRLGFLLEEDNRNTLHCLHKNLNMISFNVILLILLTHFYADFGLQTHKQAMLKSSSILYLLYHVSTYSLGMLGTGYLLFGKVGLALEFALITYWCHMITDFFTSKLSKNFFDKQDYHNGFVVVGADQVLHLVQLFITYNLLR